jgi:glycosyltransferase involved in cell wall biosynthesis
MTNAIQFSVVIPVHDDADRAAEAIASVLEQSSDSFEVVVVDDGSTVPLQCEDDPRIHLIRHDQPKGPAGARNAGAAAATGEILAFLDSDDLYLPKRLEEALVGNERADIVVARGGADLSLEMIDTARLLDTTTPHLGSVTVRRSSFLPFDETYMACEDVEWWIRVFEHGIPTCAVASDQFRYRFNDRPRVLHGQQARITHSRRLLEEHSDFFESHRTARSFRWRRIHMYLVREGNHRTATPALVQAFIARPYPKAALDLLRLVRSVAQHRVGRRKIR